MINLDRRTGTLSLLDTGLAKGRLTLDFREFRVTSDCLSWRERQGVWAATAHDCELRVSTPRGVLRIETVNTGERDVFLNHVGITFAPDEQDEPLSAREHMEYVHSQDLGKLSGVKKVGLPNRWLKPNPESGMVYAVRNIGTGRTWMVSCLPPHAGDYVTFRALHDAPHCEGTFGLSVRSEQQRLIRPGRKAAVSPIQCQTGDDPLGMLEHLGDQWAKARKRPLRDVVVGWNSWDYFAGAVTAQDMHKNQRRAKRLFGDKVRYFVIDEGYEPRWGAWVANWKFPEGLKTFCRKVKREGGIPGVWTAAFVVNNYTDVYRANPHWFGRDDGGRIVQDLLSYGPMSYLDITHPEVQQFVGDFFKRLRGDGFEYFKVDFGQLVLKCTQFHDMTLGRGGILRKGFQVIRDAIGEDAYLLGCGAPYESVAGIVDAVRATGDIHNFWAHVLANAASLSARWWMHRKLWNIDPDFFIVRSEDTTPDRQLYRPYNPKPFDMADWWLAGRELVLNEVHVYALLVYLSGGDIVLGDDLTQLDRKGVDVIRKVLDTPATKAARPVDLFGRHDALPSLWAKEEEDFHFVGVFNWEEDPADCRVDLGQVGVTECGEVRTFWSEQVLEPQGNAVTLHLPPRSCEGLVVAKRP